MTRFARRNRPETMWHGTCTPLALEILASGGFVPEPPRKRWDASTGHMASYRGTYFTNNWMMAWAAAGNATDKFGGEKVMFQTVIELERALPDEDHLPEEAHALAHSMGLSFVTSRYAHELLHETRPETLQEVLNAAAEAYLADLEQRFINRYGRYPDLKLSPRVRAELSCPVFRLMKATLKAIARLYIPSSFYGKEYRRPDETPEVRSARDEVAVALRGLLDEIPVDEWHDIFNARVDQPVGMQGLHRIVSAVEVTCPKEIGQDGIERWTSSTPENPFVIKPLLGTVTREFLSEFEKHVGGEYVIADPREALASNPPVNLPPEASDRERTILMWIREFWAAREDWGWAESRSPIDAESARRRMHRATKALEVLKLFQKRGPMPTPELYMARVWRKYHPEWKP